MKKIAVIVASLLILGGIASAQPRAVGVRYGWGYEFSFQYSFAQYQFLQVDLGTVNCGLGVPPRSAFVLPTGFRTTATYNFIFSEPTWTSRGDWAWYAGVGVALGIYHQGKEWYEMSSEEGDVVEKGWRDANYNYLLAGLVPVFGLEYTFWFPMQVSVSLNPTIGALAGRKNAPMNGFYKDGITFGWIPTLAVRYKF